MLPVVGHDDQARLHAPGERQVQARALLQHVEALQLALWRRRNTMVVVVMMPASQPVSQSASQSVS